VRSAEALSRGESGAAAVPRAAREALLQRENGSFAEKKKQHDRVKNRLFRLDATSFPISIRTASTRSIQLAGSINF
jgi:hypothetical protein